MIKTLVNSRFLCRLAVSAGEHQTVSSILIADKLTEPTNLCCNCLVITRKKTIALNYNATSDIL